MNYYEELIQEASKLALLLVNHTASCYIDINTSFHYVHVDQPINVSKTSTFFAVMDTIADQTGWDYKIIGGRAREVSRYDEPVLIWSKKS
jgi:hypothetical protein